MERQRLKNKKRFSNWLLLGFQIAFSVLEPLLILKPYTKVSIEVNLEREVFYHGEDIPVHISINNQSKKSIKKIRVSIISP